MKSEFKKLRDELFDGNVYDSKGHCNWDKVNELLDNLETKIGESSIRTNSVISISRDITSAISKYVEDIDNNKSINMTVIDYNIINSGSSDLLIISDCNNNTPFSESWNGFNKEVKISNPVLTPIENMKDLKSTFDNLVDTMRKWETFQEGDDVDLALKQMSKKVDEVNVRFECIELCNKDSEKILNKFTDGFQDNDLKSQSLNVSDFDILQRTIYDIGIVIDLEDSEPIDNDWYGLFNKPKVEPKSLGTDLAPKGVGKSISLTPMGKDIIRDRKIEIIVNTLIDIEIEGVTMEDILERVGMREQMIKQLSNKPII